MKRLLLVLTFTFFAFKTFAQTPCENGFAGEFPCDGFNLQSHINLSEMNAATGNDCWGWTDPDTGKEYAIIGLDNGTAFIDISEPANAVYLGKLPTETEASLWRDVKVYSNHAFIVSEATDHGMQVFDLTRLRNVPNPPQTFDTNGFYGGFGNAHNIAINEDSGYAYVVGTQTYAGGPHFVNIQNPTNPTAAGGFAGHFYCHDAQIVNYDGPDTDYTGREIFIGSNEDILSIVDVTDKANPVGIATLSYVNTGYTHQGWFTEDKRYFVLGDETDELFFGFNTRTLIFDLSDLDNPVLHHEYYGTTPAIDHNGYTLDNKFYLANYTAGLRVMDISNIQNGVMSEVAYFDTHPEGDNASFDGAWSVYPYFQSGNIVVSDINRGFFLLRDPNLSVEEFDKNGISLYPNPAQQHITIALKNQLLTDIEIYNTIGQKFLSLKAINESSKSIDVSSLPSGIYLVKINGNIVRRLIKK
jgi:choice-of-anchor B domain-containing protein